MLRCNMPLSQRLKSLDTGRLPVFRNSDIIISKTVTYNIRLAPPRGLACGGPGVTVQPRLQRRTIVLHSLVIAVKYARLAPPLAAFLERRFPRGVRAWIVGWNG